MTSLPTSPHAVPGGLRAPRADPRRVLRAFASVFAPGAFLLFLPYACWEGTAFGCLDRGPLTVHNVSGRDVLVTPFFVDDDGDVQPLVVHGFQRGRFSVASGTRREVDVETGDYHLAGVALDFGDGVTRVFLPESLAASKVEPSWKRSYALITSQSAYARASDDIARATSTWAVVAPLMESFICAVVAPPLPFALTAALVARRRSRQEKLDALRKRSVTS